MWTQKFSQKKERSKGEIMKHAIFFSETEESRAVFRELRATIIKLKIYEWNDGPPVRLFTHRFCLQYAIKLRNK
jgi:hypothetical protein